MLHYSSINFRNSHRRDLVISRPERELAGEEANSKGVKGWDYQFEGENFSHKVGKGISDIALLWDATIELPADKKWSYDSTMVFVLSNYKGTKAKLLSDNKTQIEVKSILQYRKQNITTGQVVYIAERLSRIEWKIQEAIQLNEASDIQEALPLKDIWGKMIEYSSKSKANKFDIFVTSKSVDASYLELVNSRVKINYEAHPGVYVFERELLQNIVVKKNNRAVLLPRSTVLDLTENAAEQGLFIFMPSWYMAYAENRPADLYLAQKQEFDLMNSASRRL